MREREWVFLFILCNVYMNLFASLKNSFYVFFHFIRVWLLALRTTILLVLLLLCLDLRLNELEISTEMHLEPSCPIMKMV